MEESAGYPFVFQLIDRDSADLSSLKHKSVNRIYLITGNDKGLYVTMKRWRIDPWLYGD